MDKHNLVLPVIALGELFDAYLVNETGSRRIKFSGNALPNGVPRAVLTDYGRAKLEIKQKGNPAFSVTFPETTKVFAGDPIIPTLAQCSQFASEAIRIMAKHFGVPTEILAPLDWDGRGASY